MGAREPGARSLVKLRFTPPVSHGERLERRYTCSTEEQEYGEA